MSDRHRVAGRKGGIARIGALTGPQRAELASLGGQARMHALTDEERAELSRRGATGRWEGRPEIHQVVRMMLEQIAETGAQHCLYVRGRTAWFAPSGHDSESRWQDRWVGTYGPGAVFEDVMEDVR